MSATGVAVENRRVRVWFGSHVVAHQVYPAGFAARYEQAMRRRFPSLRVTNEAVEEKR